MKKILLLLLALAGAQVGSTQARAADILNSAKSFYNNPSNIQSLMTVVGQSRKLALAGCPQAVGLIIRSYNAKIFHEKSR